MRNRFLFVLMLLLALAMQSAASRNQNAGALGVNQPVSCLKWRYDLGNTGWNSREALLNASNVNKNSFGKIYERPVDGQVYAMPLYAPNVPIPNKGAHNVLIVCTEHNTVYAFDAASVQPPNDQPLWSVNLGPSVPTGVVGCGDLGPEYGITSTPVIDLPNNVVYVSAKTLENNKQTWRLHALDLRTGQERGGWGFIIQGSSIGTFGQTITFMPEIQLNRSGLTLVNGRVYVTFGSHCDINLNQYRGWMFSYNTANPGEPPQILCTARGSNGNSEAANGMWMGGASPAFDSNGNIFVMIGNGAFNIDIGGDDLGDSWIKIPTFGGTSLAFVNDPKNYLTPSNQDFLRAVDADLGSGGLILLPDQTGTTTPHLLVGGGKDALIRLINRDNMGGYNGRINPNAPTPALQEVGGNAFGFWSSPSYWGSTNGNYIYSNGVGGTLRQLRLVTNAAGASQLAPVAESQMTSGYPSSTPVVSSNGSMPGTGVVWLLNRNDNALHAFDAGNVSRELYNSNQMQARDGLPGVIKFTVPMVANGMVFVGTDGKLVAYSNAIANTNRLDHFAINGPANVAIGQQASFELTALDVLNQPVPLSQIVPMQLVDPRGTITNFNLTFKGQSSVTWQGSFATLTGPYKYIAAPGTKQQATLQFNVRQQATNALDHFNVVVPPKVVTGTPFNFTVNAVDKNNTPVNITGNVPVRVVLGDGSVANLGTLAFNASNSATGQAKLAPVGPAVMIAEFNFRSGTGEFVIVPPPSVVGFAIPGDWLGHNRLKATIRLLDPANHANVIQTTTLFLQDDYGFNIAAPAGNFDVAVKVDHWLTQIIKGYDTTSGIVLQFKGPNGNGLLNGDTDGNDKVDDTDIANIMADFGGPQSGLHGMTDLNGDAIVNQRDLDIANKNKGHVGDT